MEELKPCPLCGNKVHWNVCGGLAAFGCGEYEFEVSCQCGLNFNSGPYDCKEDAEHNGIVAWNTRHEREGCVSVEKSGPCYTVYHYSCCGYEHAESKTDFSATEIPANYCPNCGAKIVD